jgi:hypothetical protein
VVKGTAWFQEEIDEKNEMWVGNVFVCDNKGIKVTAVLDGLTEKAITTRVFSPAHVPTLRPMAVDVTVPPGDSIRFQLGVVGSKYSADATPRWIPDPADSKWLLFGGETGVLSTHGVEFMPSSEGVLESASIAQTSCAHSVLPTAGRQPGYFYLRTDKREEMSAWLGKGHEALLTVRYYDEASGSLSVLYDSADYTWGLNTLAPGTWKGAGSIRLAGSRTFKTFVYPIGNSGR